MTDNKTDKLLPIPQPAGVPLLGNILDINAEFPLGSFQDLADQHGEIFSLNLPGRTVVFLNSQELVHEACDEKRFRKPIANALEEIRNGVNDGLFTAREQEVNWGIAHRVLMPAFGPASIQAMFTEMHEIASQLALKWARHGPSDSIMVTDDFTRLTLDTLALCAMNFRFNSYYHDDLHPFIQAMGDFLTDSGSRSRRPALLPSFLYRGADQKYQDDIQVLRETAQGVLDARKKQPTGRRDLMSAMLEGVDPKTGQKMTDSSIIDNLITFLIAGHETTSGLLSFAFYLLIKHPEAYRKAQSEVNEVVGKGPITLEHMKKLPYISAVLRETLRLCPTIPVFGRQAKEDEIIGGKYAVPKDQVLFLLLAKSHLDPKVYGETAKDFVPERMLDESFERLTKEYPDCWKPFGTGMRACIGRPFAWQEALLVVVMLLQNFDFALDDPTYELKYKQTLTTKPKDFYMRATLRDGLTPTELEHRLAGGPVPSATKAARSDASAKLGGKEGKPMSIYYGSNTGTCESLAQVLATDAAAHGFTATVVEPMDAATKALPTDRPVVLITASFEGQPPDNATTFCNWVQDLKGDELANVQYAVFGCGHHDWSQTFHKVPKLLDQTMEARKGSRLCEMGLTDVADGDMFTDFEQWGDDVFWPAVEAKYGTSGADTEAGDTSSLTVRFSTPRSSNLRQDVREASVVDAKVLTAPGAAPKKHIEIQLPGETTYKVGDYLTVLPVSPNESVSKVMRHFQLSRDSHITINSDRWTALPTNTPVPVYDVLGSYVELSQPATKRGILKLVEATSDESIKQQLQDLAGASYSTEISNKRVTILNLLERFPSITFPFSIFLSLLPPMRPRPYSISSSPLKNPTRATLTYSLVEQPAWANPAQRHTGVASSYLASLQPGDRLYVAVRPTNASSFRLPDKDAMATTPIICVAAGAGLAPFRGFIEERAVLAAGGSDLATGLLFFGCRGAEMDDLYRGQFDKWEEIGAVGVRRAFSRVEGDEAKGCKYVQDRLLHDRDEVKKLWDQGARVYVCGTRHVGDGVKEAMGKIVLGGEPTDEEITKWHDSVRNERYAVDVFD